MSSTPGLTQMALPVTGPPTLESRVRAIESLLAVLQEKIANLEGISAYVRTIEAVHSEVSGLKQTFATWTAGAAATACATTAAAASASASASAQLDPYACTEDPSSCAISEQDMFKEFSELQLQDMDAFTEFASATTTAAATTHEASTAAATTHAATPAAVHVHPEVVRVVHMKPTLSARAQGFREKLRSMSDADLKAFRVPEIKDMLSAFGKAYPGSKDAALAVLKTCIVP
jgi:hypothetical protein